MTDQPLTLTQQDNLVKKVSIRSIGPAEAAEMLSRNASNNRQLRTGDVSKYASDMLKGLWHDDVSAITFDSDNRLTNGQHRLNAIIESKTTQSFIVAENWPKEAMLTMDIGNKRSFHDRVTVLGVDMEKTVCTLVMHSMTSWYSSQAGATTLNYRGKENRVISVYKKHKEFADFIGHRYKRSVSPLILGVALHGYAQACVWYTKGKLEDEPLERITRFLDIVSRGPVMEAYNPTTDGSAVVLREWIQAEKIRNHRATKGEYHRIVCSTLARFLKGHTPVREITYTLKSPPFLPMEELPGTDLA